MAKNENQHLRPVLLKADEDARIVVQGLSDYHAVNPAYSLEAFEAAYAEMQSARQAELMARKMLESARDNAVAAEWHYHNVVLGVKQQVIAQYGNDSNEVQSLGIKKKSEYSNRKRRRKADDATPPQS
ncbi:MAG: hypothetical protein WA821_15675 [Anaerolineales bacterium]